MTTSEKIHHEIIRIRDYERDISGNIPIWTLCNYLQMSASNHAHILGCAFDQLSPMGITWVLTRLKIRLHKPPVSAKTVHLETWPCGLKALTAKRDFRITLPDDPAPLATASSTWVILRLDSRRPARVPTPVAARIPYTPPLYESRWDKIGDIPRSPSNPRFRVRLSDIDLNKHVNNVRYLEWAAETITPPDAPHDTVISGASMEFLAEAHLGETIQVASNVSPIGLHSTWHNIYRESDGTLLTRIELHTEQK